MVIYPNLGQKKKNNLYRRDKNYSIKKYKESDNNDDEPCLLNKLFS